jgi:hypothetical protein
MCTGLHIKSIFNETSIFSTDFQKNTYESISNFLKICTVQAEMFQFDTQIGRKDEVNSHYLQFCKHI